ncbi:MAG: hypothetical protein ABIH20_00840 [Candidatus Diapherotrites archaeon]
MTKKNEIRKTFRNQKRAEAKARRRGVTGHNKPMISANEFQAKVNALMSKGVGQPEAVRQIGEQFEIEF